MMRHELKHTISYEDYLIISNRLKTFMVQDQHVSADGKYDVHSLYFDNIWNKALMEKINGVDCREKFRIRYYNQEYKFIKLEKKSKMHGLCDKKAEILSMEEVNSICLGKYDFLKDKCEGLYLELYSKMQYEILRPRCIVHYAREPYIYAPGNVRVTFDYNLSMSPHVNSFFNLHAGKIPIQPGVIIMEVKWDAYLPDNVLKSVRVPNRKTESYSKYASSRWI